MQLRTMKINEEPASFKDPSGFVFYSNNKLFRQINVNYKENYDHLMRSGLYRKLTEAEMLISHQEIKANFLPKKAYRIIKPTLIPFISYPYEWCFSQLKDAALLTLAIQKEALNHGMSLRDASSFNVQFSAGKPIFIDTLSFRKYEEGKPWSAYKQFCEQFLAPLAISAYTDARLVKLQRPYLEGIPLALSTKLMPLSAWIKPSLFFHIFLHAKSQKKFSKLTIKQTRRSFSKRAFLWLIDNLEEAINGLRWRGERTVWSDYYQENKCISYEELSMAEKKNLVSRYLNMIHPKTVWDIGANTGVFSQIAAKTGAFVVSIDNDSSVIENNYLWIKKTGEKNILPLLIDIVNPSPGTGWENKERSSFLSRTHPDAILALALIHHLAIGKNLPFSKIAQFFEKTCRFLVIEFVPKEDKQVHLLLKNRLDIFNEYQQTVFEREFGKYFNIKVKSKLPDSKRSLYLMVKKRN